MSPLTVTGSIGVEVVEVLRGTTAGPLLVAAGAVGGFAALASLVLAAHLLLRRQAPDSEEARSPHQRPAGAEIESTPDEANSTHDDASSRCGDGARQLRWVLSAAGAASVVELALLLADGRSPGDRWVLVVLARLVVVTAAAFAAPVPERPDGPRVAVGVGSALVLLATSVLGAPTASNQPLVPMGVLAAATGVVLLTVAADHLAVRTGQRTQITVGVLLVLGLPAAWLSTPDVVPAHHQERIAVGALLLDVTVAPVAAGTNEAHLYAFDRSGRPAPVGPVHLELVGAPTTRHELFPVSPDHHLSYVLELAGPPPWNVRFEVATPSGQRHEVLLRLGVP